MGIEIDFLPVGDGCSGDAIVVRIGDLRGTGGQSALVIIDGGTLEAGQRVVNHCRRYHPGSPVFLALVTHLDNDHVSGVRRIIEQLEVQNLAMHLPWDHAPFIKEAFAHHAWTDKGLSDKFRSQLSTAHDLYRLACSKGIPVTEPFPENINFQVDDTVFRVLGPDREYYQILLPQDPRTPKAKPLFQGLASIGQSSGSSPQWYDETDNSCNLDDWCETQPQNNTSVICYVATPSARCLLTGDAGKGGLSRAADHALLAGLDLSSLHFMQVPHHGSRRNLGPSILARVMAGVGIISAGANDPKHPSQRVINELIRRGMNVYTTAGRQLRQAYDAPAREGWSSATKLGLNPYFYE